MALSDVLGNETVQIYLANIRKSSSGATSGTASKAVSPTSINHGGVSTAGMGIFRLNQVYDPDLDIVRREPRTGILGLAMYPFNKYTRVEGSVLIRHATDHLLRDGVSQSVDLVSHYLSLVHDNASWSESGPSSGSRWILSGGFTRGHGFRGGRLQHGAGRGASLSATTVGAGVRLADPGPARAPGRTPSAITWAAMAASPATIAAR